MSAARKLRHGENAFAWLLLVFSAGVLVVAWRISGFKSVSSPGAFPMFAGAVMVAAMAAVLVGNRRKERPGTAGWSAELRAALRENFPRVVVVFIAIIVGYMLALQPLTFLPSSFAFLFLATWFLGGSTPLRSLMISALTLGGVYVIFHTLFKVVLP